MAVKMMQKERSFIKFVSVRDVCVKKGRPLKKNA